MLETLRPDPTFYPSPKLAMQAPAENYAYVLMLSPDGSQPDALGVVDVRRELQHLRHARAQARRCRTRATSSTTSAGTPAAPRSRRLPAMHSSGAGYLIIPGLRSSRIYIVDTDPHPAQAKLAQGDRARGGLPQDRLLAAAHRPLRPGGRSTSARWAARARTAPTGPPGVFIMDCETFEVLGRWEIDRGPQKLHYDFWWNLPRDYMVSSEWGLPPQFENGIVAGRPSRQPLRPPAPLLGPARPPQRADHRSRRQPPDGARGAAGPRPDARAWLRRRRSRHDEPRRRRSGPGGARAASSTSKKTATIPPEPAPADDSAAAAQGLRRGAAARDRHRPLA